MSEDNLKVKCVGEAGGETTDELKEAREILIENGFKPLWITPAECLDMEQKDRTSVYLIDPFEGEAFHHLAAIGCRVYGPQCILSCMLLRMEIPRRRVPIYNMAMKDVLVSCTSIEKDVREKIHKQVEYMAGEVSKDFTDAVTHLVAGEVGSKKYVVAGSLGKHIMMPKWVTAVWEKAKYRHVHATDDQFQKYRCPIFSGLVVTVSGLDQDERKEVKKTIEAEGGKYTGEMKMKECTHLIVKEAKGQKYEHASKWKIHIVRPRWLYDSVEKGYCLDETDYRVEKNLNTTGQHKTSTPDRERSTIHATHLGDISSISNLSVISGINETTAALQRTHVTEDPLESLDVTHIPGDVFLDGCKFYLSGFRGSSLEKLRKIINAGGATRFNTINESVTHVLMGEKIQSDIDMLRNSDLRPHIVSAAWLVDCYKKEKIVDVEPYLCLELPALDPTSPKMKGKRKSSKTVAAPKPADADATQNPADQNDMDDILSQYLPQESTEKDAEKETAVEAANEDETITGNNYDEVDGGTQSTQEGDKGIFYKKSIVFFGFDEEQISELGNYIKERGGRVVGENHRVVADYGIVPIDGYPVSITVNEVLTNVWLQMCIEEEKLLPVQQNQLFLPIDMINNIDELKPLDGCVLSISGFSGTERDCLMHIAMIIGASCQEYFVRRANKGLLASTHLLVKEASGTKYEAAKKWKLPAVSKLWLFACAKSGKREPEADYTIDKVTALKSGPESVPNIPKHEPASKHCDNQPDTNSNNNNITCKEPKTSALEEVTPVSVKPPNAVASAEESQGRPNVMDPKASTLEKVTPVEERPADSVIPTSSAEESLSRPNVMDPMSGAKSLMEKELALKESLSQKENISLEPTDITNRPQHSRVKELHLDKPQTPKAASPSKSGNDTPGKFLRSGVSFVPKYNIADTFTSLQSPLGDGSQKHRRRSSVPLGEYFLKHVKKAVENSSVKRTEDQDIGDDQHSEEMQGPLHGVVIAVSKKLLLNQAEYNNIVEDLGGFYSWKQDGSCTHFIFQGRANDTSKEFRLARDQGIFIVSPHWLFACKEQRARVDEGQFPHNYNPNLSLTVSGGRTPGRPSRRAARNSVRGSDKNEQSEQPKKHESLEDQKKHQEELRKKEEQRLKEEQRVKERQTEEQRLNLNEEEQLPDREGDRSLENQQEEMAQDEPNTGVEHDVGGTLEIREELSKQMEAIMNSAGKIKKQPRKKSKRLDGSGQFNTSGNTSDSGRSRPSSRQSPWAYQDEKKGVSRRTRSGSKSSDTNSMPEASQSVQVTWDDPTGRLEQEKLADELHRQCSQSQNTDDYLAGIDLSSSNAQFSELEDPAATTKENVSRTRSSKRKSQETVRTPTPEAPPLAFPEPRRTSRVMSPQPVEIMEEEQKKKERKLPVILVSGMQHDERVDYGALVEQLGGKLLDSQHFDTSCTHLVVETPARNEKFLACVAAGKWVLHKSYFEACRREGYFVKEECHEWGSEATHNIMLNMNAQCSKLAAAANRWRQKVKEMKKIEPSCRGAFEGWQVILCTDKNRESNFSRLLQAGGAEVLPLKPPFSSDVTATHAFLELNKVKLSQDDLENLIKSNIHCLKPEFIAAHLTEDPCPNPDDYSPPEITALRASLPDSMPTKRKNSATEGSGKRPRRH
ncbi:DNA topoisomerase 2-binding protein 1-like [Haliotis asinina]|uniref:DNA topoisomerase 2-binding protein 1-like n=1 Tax=Haliotis asinina TaxID=109174 RepID=UPI003531FAC0